MHKGVEPSLRNALAAFELPENGGRCLLDLLLRSDQVG